MPNFLPFIARKRRVVDAENPDPSPNSNFRQHAKHALQRVGLSQPNQRNQRNQQQRRRLNIQHNLRLCCSLLCPSRVQIISILQIAILSSIYFWALLRSDDISLLLSNGNSYSNTNIINVNENNKLTVTLSQAEHSIHTNTIQSEMKNGQGNHKPLDYNFLNKDSVNSVVDTETDTLVADLIHNNGYSSSNNRLEELILFNAQVESQREEYWKEEERKRKEKQEEGKKKKLLENEAKKLKQDGVLQIDPMELPREEDKLVQTDQNDGNKDLTSSEAESDFDLDAHNPDIIEKISENEDGHLNNIIDINDNTFPKSQNGEKISENMDVEMAVLNTISETDASLQTNAAKQDETTTNATTTQNNLQGDETISFFPFFSLIFTFTLLRSIMMTYCSHHTTRLSNLTTNLSRTARQARYDALVSRINQTRIQNGENPIPADILQTILLRGRRDFSPNDYDQLLRLNEEDGPSQALLASLGATRAEIERLPSRIIQNENDDLISSRRHNNSSGSLAIMSQSDRISNTSNMHLQRPQCTVCLEPFKVGEHVRSIPCFHTFHSKCIDPWLQIKAECPICKFSAMG